MISVVLANYNGAKYLEEALRSVLVQSLQDFELIVVDDGSTDSSREIIEKIAAEAPAHVRPVLQSTNVGQGPSFNVGVEHARGELVAFMDSDDLWMPHKLSRLQEMWERAPAAVLFQHNLCLHVDGMPTEKRFRETLLSGDVFTFVKRTGVFPLFVPTSGLAFAKHALQRVMPIPANFRTCADGYLTRTSMVLGRVYASDECLGYYRKHSGNHVLGNSAHNNETYARCQLLPALNAFYRSQGIEFSFPIPPPWAAKLPPKVRRLLKELRN